MLRDDGGCWEQWITQDLDIDLLVPGARYEFSMAYQSSEVTDWGWGLSLFLRNATIDEWYETPLTVDSDGAWQTVSCDFTLGNDLGEDDISMNIHFCVPQRASWRLDDISLRKMSE